MTAHALSALGAGFSDEALGSQAVFRAVLQALSQPGAPAQARFVWVAQGDALPPLQTLAQGSDANPDQSATCVVDVQDLAADSAAPDAWQLSGPGIRAVQRLRVTGMPAGFEPQWADNHAAFPRGVDLVLATATHLAGLPRTTRIPSAQEA